MQNRENDSPATVREMCWDEDNRLMVLSDNGKTQVILPTKTEI